MPKSMVPTEVAGNAQAHEDKHVHMIYDKIATHFSSTRYKPWPIIARFLSTLPTGSIGLDSGTGNGKYLPLPLDRPPGSICTIGLDRSRNLLEIAQTARHDADKGSGDRKVLREVIWGDVIGKGWRDGAFDYAISIATIHHLATYERRKLAVKRLIQCVSPTQGRILIYVWAIEQDELSRRKVPIERQQDVSAASGIGPGRDVFVPWVLSTENTSTAKPKPKPKRGQAPSTVAVTDTSQNDPKEAAKAPALSAPDTPPVFDRYYHMFANGELAEIVRSAATDLGLHIGSFPDETAANRTRTGARKGLEIVQEGWERSNYYVELRCWEI